MFMKSKIVRSILCVILGLIGLYTGVSCAATLHKAAAQPYLVSGAVRLNFMGYYMMAALNGVICVASIFVLVWLLIRMKKSKS